MRQFSYMALAIILLSIFGAVVVNQKTMLDFSDNQVTENTLNLISSMRNGDITWDGSYGGMLPVPNGATLALLDNKEEITSLLLHTLLDDDKFAAAHVLLVMRESIPYSSLRVTSVSEPNEVEWLGLQVQLYDDWTATYQGNNLEKLQKFWENHFRK